MARRHIAIQYNDTTKRKIIKGLLRDIFRFAVPAKQNRNRDPRYGFAMLFAAPDRKLLF